ncbi:MAG: tripartite tricarboxylate transporter TctB family protein [Spirochaetales bacterium]|jgi:putative tricarboxylic transport membrane protein
MTNRQRDIIAAVVFLAFGGFMFGNSLGIHPIIPNEVGSGYVPKFLSIVSIVLSLALLVLTLLKKKIGPTEKTDEDIKGGIFTVMALAAYVILFEFLGFLVSTALYLFVQIMILSNEKNRKFLVLGIISIVVPLVIYGLFKSLFNMPFPTGILGI